MLGSKKKFEFKNPVNNEILNIAWPVLIELILGSVFGMIDMMMLGNIANPDYAASAVASVGVTNQPLFLGLAVVQALNVGGTAIVARYYGAGKKSKMENVTKHVMIISMILSLPIAVFGFIYAGKIMAFMGAEQHTIDIGINYFRIICISYLFQSYNFSITGSLRGIGETKVPMHINIRVNFLNVIGNAILIYGLLGFPTLGVVGAAVSTAFANLIASIFMTRYLMSGKSELLFSFKNKFKFSKRTMRNLVTIGLPSALEQVVLRTGIILFVQVVSGLGTVVFAAHQIGTNILSLSFVIGQSFGIAASSLVGKSLGARDSDAAQRYAHQASKMGSASGFIIGILMFVGAPFLVGLYSSDPAIIENGAIALRMAAVMQPFQANQLIVAGSLRGAGDTRFPLISTFIGILGVRVILANVFIKVFALGLMGAWLAVIIDQFVRWVMIQWRFRSGKWKHVQFV
ncbi:MATE family efflux transporter [Jeotgalibaca sp. MA1X17-3]|uniref:MATE family efflux transporter n=1 Tax=Jeotgalibaca sp. MA1X17-3 TaxID=2908211 RepID=UPI001F46CFAB|nr:MATE family efflux transporter [Jeotgalibaca sp. MA1X17-3]UJF15367.1 MATE family efflux transporter [Jeotgalibaca sp. MA1X17-3]